ncbi:MAG: RidA family protein [Eubacteriales bacterium]|nr:RidA family protein [Eubacteriales bacterium]
MKKINSANAPAAIGPYSQAIEANGFVYVSGQLPIVNGELKTDVAEATHASLGNIQHILAEAGLTMKDVVKVEIFLADMNDFAIVNEVYAQYFAEPFPARACVQVARLPKDACVEIQCIAVK